MFPKRGAIAAALTAAGLALLFSFKTPERVVTLARVGTGTGSGTTSGSSATSGSGTTRDQTTTTPVDDATATPTPSASPSSGSTANGTVTGPVVETQFGPVQVAVTFSNGTVTDIQALQLPSDRMRSQEISSYAEPLLRQEALQAQSAQIDLVSGATYTSSAYEQSLQAVLDQAGA
jgi:uncharacterized protein with FMN-binding domain